MSNRSTEQDVRMVVQSEVRPLMKPLSVCHIVSGDLWAGAEVQAAGIIEGLSRRPDMRVVAIVLNRGRLERELRENGVPVCVIPEESHSFRQILKRAEEFIKAHKPDVLHSHRYKENLLSVLLARRCKVPLTIRTQHGWPEPVAGMKGLRHRALLCVDTFCGWFMTDAVIGVSGEMMPRLQRIYGRRAVLVRNAIDAERVVSRLSRAEAKSKLSIPADAAVVGIVGRLETIKRVDIFLESAKLLIEAFPHLRFVVAGAGSLQEELRELASSLKLDHRVHFVGHREDAYDVLRALHVLVMCSDSEGLPMVLLEAFCLGLPVVGRRVGGIKELLGDDECGLAVDGSSPQDFASTVLRLLRDPALCDRLCGAAAARVRQQFSLERAVEEVANEYWRLAEQIRD